MGKAANTTIDDLGSIIPRAKALLEDARREVERLRAAKRENDQRPIVVEELLQIAQPQLEEDRQSSLQRLWQQELNMSEVDLKHRYLDTEGGVVELRLRMMSDIINAAGFRSIALKNAAGLGSAPNATTTLEKTKEGQKIQAKLDAAEARLERARLQLQGLGLVFLPDAKLQAHIFLEFSNGSINGRKFKWLRDQFDDLNRIGRELVSYNRRAVLDLSQLNDYLRRVREAGEKSAIDAAEAKISELNVELADLRSKIEENDRARQTINRLLNECERFAKENRIVL